MVVAVWGYNLLADHLTVLWVVTAFWMFLLFFFFFFIKGSKKQFVFGIIVHLYFFCLGLSLYATAEKKTRVSWPDTTSEGKAVLIDNPRKQGKTVVATAMEQGNKLFRRRIVQMAFLENSETSHLKIGDAVQWVGHPDSLCNRGNPNEFDYAGWLRRQGIEGRLFLTDKCWKRCSPHDSAELVSSVPLVIRWKIKALVLRENLLALYRETEWSEEVLGVLSALTLGEKKQLSSHLKTIYSETGAGHVLALSGLHLGVLYVALNSFFLLLLPFRKYQWLRMLFLLIGIWLFTWLTGMPLSLLRAAMMTTCMAIGSCIGHRSSSLNHLAMAAFLILVISPLSLKDVGFQLSFMAVAAILLFAPRGYPEWCPSNKIIRYIISLLTISICAQIGVAPLVAYYFHLFPTYFPITNLCVIPCTFLIVCGAVLFFLLGWFGWIQQALGWILDLLVSLMNSLLDSICHWPVASISVYPSLLTVFLSYLIIIQFCFYLLCRKTSCLKGLFVSVLFMLVWEGYCNRDSSVPSQLVFYNQPSFPAVHFIVSKERSYIWMGEMGESENKLKYIKESFWKPEGILPPIQLTKARSDKGFYYLQKLACLKEKRIVLAVDSTWYRRKVSSLLKVDYLYVTKSFPGTIAMLHALFIPRLVILDASLGKKQTKRFAKECDMFGWKYYDLTSKGALKIIL